MVLAVDADVLLKLARLGILHLFEDTAKNKSIELHWLGSAFYTLGLSHPDSPKTIRKCQRATVARDLAAFCARHEAIEADPTALSGDDRELFALLATSPSIHPGEAVLLALAASSNMHVLTDDVRAMVSIQNQERFLTIRPRLEHRWVCLLQVVKLLIREHGFDVVKAHVVRDLSCDTAIRAAFGSGPAALEVAVLEALTYFIGDRQAQAPSLYGDIDS